MDKTPKIDRKALKTPDKFVVRGQQLLTLLAEQRMRLVPLLVLVLVGVLAAYAYDGWSSHKLEKSWEAYYAASKEPDAQKWDAFKKVCQDWGNNRATYFSAVGLADHYFAEARKQALQNPPGKDLSSFSGQAEEWYGKAAAFADLLPAERQLLYINRGGAFEMEKKYDLALGEYQKASDLGGDIKPFAQLQIARVWVLKDDKKKAEDLYEKLSVDNPESEYGKQAKSELRLLKSPLFQNSGQNLGKS